MNFNIICSSLELYTKFSCTYCQEDIVGVRVHCAECTDFELCPQVIYYVCSRLVTFTLYLQAHCAFVSTCLLIKIRFVWCSVSQAVLKLVHTKMITGIDSWYVSFSIFTICLKGVNLQKNEFNHRIPVFCR